jgi:hypothetical protein
VSLTTYMNSYWFCMAFGLNISFDNFF